jgi:hypothetical protein
LENFETVLRPGYLPKSMPLHLVLRWSTTEDVRRVDEALARVGRCAARVRLRIGECLQRLAEQGGHEELAFPTLSAYALERCERPARWAGESRALARRLSGEGRAVEGGLPRIRAAVMKGSLSWSMAELLARHAKPDDEAELLQEASEKTVRQMRAFLKQRAAGEPEDGAAGEPDEGATAAPTCEGEKASDGAGAKEGGGDALPIDGAEAGGDADDADDEDDGDEEQRWPMRLRARPEEVFMLEASRILVELLDGARASDDHLMSALLAEAESAIYEAADGRGRPIPLSGLDSASAKAFREQLNEARRQERAKRERKAEAKIPIGYAPEKLDPFGEEEPLPTDYRGLDAEIRRCCALLAERDLLMGHLARMICGPNSWKRLKYASEQQYARERVGVSLSSLVHRMTLSRRVEVMPEIGAAIRAGELGYEAAMLVGRVATPDTAPAWVTRARERTLVHLREEVEAVERRARLRLDSSLEPPDEDDLEEVADFERAVQRGDLLDASLKARGPRTQMSVNDGAGRELTFRVSDEVREHFEQLHAQFQRLTPADAPLSFIGFLCVSLWQSWLPRLQQNKEKWKHIYLRDRYRCRSPVCGRRNCTPHHLERQSQGGGDEDENMATLCFWCHIFGVHTGRLTADPPASNIRWKIGRTPIMEIEGRTRRLLAA